MPSYTIRTRRRKLWLLTEGRCWYCGAQLVEHTHDTKKNSHQWTWEYKFFLLTMDHIQSKVRKGKDGFYNSVPSCGVCNVSKDRFSVEEYRERVYKLLTSPNPNTRNLPSFHGQARREALPFAKEKPRLWKLTENSVLFYGEMLEMTRAVYGFKLREKLSQRSPASWERYLNSRDSRRKSL